MIPLEYLEWNIDGALLEIIIWANTRCVRLETVMDFGHTKSFGIVPLRDGTGTHGTGRARALPQCSANREIRPTTRAQTTHIPYSPFPCQSMQAHARIIH